MPRSATAAKNLPKTTDVTETGEVKSSWSVLFAPVVRNQAHGKHRSYEYIKVYKH